MPDPFERHSKLGAHDWGTQPSRSQQRRLAAADDSEPTPVSSRMHRRWDKDRCKKNHGGEHTPELVLSKWSRVFSSCQWGSSWLIGDTGFMVIWRCSHELHCAKCGKVLNVSIADTHCPAYPGTEDQRAHAQDRVDEANERARNRPQRKIITGRTGYRRPKGGG